MPAKSKSQQRLFGMVHAYKKGELDTKGVDAGLLKKIKKIAGGIEDKSAKKFAKTKHKGLPEVKESTESPKCPKCKQRTVTKGKRDKKTGLPELKCKCGFVFGTTKATFENKLTFKQFLVEITEKERKAMTPPASVQKVLVRLMKEHGTINRHTFYHTLATKFDLSPAGLQRIIEREPWVRAIPFEDLQKQLPGRRKPFDHITNKHQNRT